MGDKIYYKGEPRDPWKAILYYQGAVKIPQRALDELKSLDKDGDQFITFEEAGRDKLKFVRLAHYSNVSPKWETTLEVARQWLAGDMIKQRERDKKAAEPGRKTPHSRLQ